MWKVYCLSYPSSNEKGQTKHESTFEGNFESS